MWWDCIAVDDERDLLVTVLDDKTSNDIKVKATQAAVLNYSFKTYLLNVERQPLCFRDKEDGYPSRSAALDINNAVSVERAKLRPQRAKARWTI